MVSKWLGQEVYRAGLHNPNRHWYVGMAGNEDNGQVDTEVGELQLEVKPLMPGSRTSRMRQPANS